MGTVNESQTPLAIQPGVLRVNPLVNGVTVGLLAGLGLAGLTLFLRIRDGQDAGPHLALVGQVFIGYTVSYVGAAVGFVWAFAVFGGATYLASRVYNAVASRGARRD